MHICYIFSKYELFMKQSNVTKNINYNNYNYKLEEYSNLLSKYFSIYVSYVCVKNALRRDSVRCKKRKAGKQKMKSAR